VTAPVSSNDAKYQSGNPILRRLIARFQRRAVELVGRHRFTSVLDVGCGEGHLARVLLDRFPGVAYTGLDPSSAAIEAAKARCPAASFRVAGVEALDADPARYELVVCSEVLEHLSDPTQAMARLQARCSGAALLTVPWEPWFQLANLARGKYLRGLGNHPEHVQHWSLDGFREAASPYFREERAEALFPWILYVGAPR